MTIQAPAHRQRRDLIDARHPIDPTMTGFAADPLPYVNRVIEVDEVRKLMNASPGHGCARQIALPDGGEFRTLDPDLTVTVQTSLRRRNSRHRRTYREIVAVETVDPIIRNMMPVIECDRLSNRNSLAGDLRRSNPDHQKHRDTDNHEESYDDPGPQDRIGGRTEGRGHRLKRSSISKEKVQHGSPAEPVNNQLPTTDSQLKLPFRDGRPDSDSHASGRRGEPPQVRVHPELSTRRSGPAVEGAVSAKIAFGI